MAKRSDGGPLTPADQARVGTLATAIAGAQIPGIGRPVTGPQAVAPNKLVQLINVPVTAAPTDNQGQMDAVPSLTALLGHAAWWPGHGDVAKVASGPAPIPDPVPAEST